jgi:hypothetical protein
MFVVPGQIYFCDLVELVILTLSNAKGKNLRISPFHFSVRPLSQFVPWPGGIQADVVYYER